MRLLITVPAILLLGLVCTLNGCSPKPIQSLPSVQATVEASVSAQMTLPTPTSVPDRGPTAVPTTTSSPDTGTQPPRRPDLAKVQVTLDDLPVGFIEFKAEEFRDGTSAFLKIEPFEVVTLGVVVDPMYRPSLRLPTADSMSAATAMFVRGVYEEIGVPQGAVETVVAAPLVGETSRTTSILIDEHLLETDLAGWPYVLRDDVTLTFEITVFYRRGVLGFAMVFVSSQRQDGPFSIQYAHLLDKRVLELFPEASGDLGLSHDVSPKPTG